MLVPFECRRRILVLRCGAVALAAEQRADGPGSPGCHSLDRRAGIFHGRLGARLVGDSVTVDIDRVSTVIEALLATALLTPASDPWASPTRQRPDVVTALREQALL